MSRGGEEKINPYSKVGREKFSVVLSELEAKKKRIMAKSGGSQDVDTVVRFKYSSTGTKGWIPIVVRPKAQQPTTPTQPPPPPSNLTLLQQIQEEDQSEAIQTKSVTKPKDHDHNDVAINKKCRSSSRRRLTILYWNVHYWQVVVVLVLACLLLLGKVFAIWCVTIFWYALPVLRLHDGDANLWRFESPGILLPETTNYSFLSKK